MANSDRRKVTTEDIEHLIEVFNQSGWDEMHLEAEGLEIFLSNDPRAQLPPTAGTPAPAGGVAGQVVLATPASTAASTSVRTIAATGPTSHSSIPEGQIAIRAPSLGTFYRAPKPGAPPYIELGQQIEITTEVGLIEVMKLFTPVQGGVRGIVREIRARDGQMVEFDDVLLVLDPN